MNKLEKNLDSNDRIIDSMQDRVDNLDSVDPGFQKRQKPINPCNLK